MVDLPSSQRFNYQSGPASHYLLLIEDSEDSYHLVSRALAPAISVSWARNCEEAASALRVRAWDCILLDVVLPDGDGFQIAADIQRDESLKKIPLIFLTGQTTLSDRVMGISIGADDYITKPFEGIELKARVENRIRKSLEKNTDSETKRLGDLEVHMGLQKAFLWENGKKQEIDLTPIEFKLLLQLVRDPQKVVSRDELVSSVWGENVHIISRSVDTHISKLRKKMGTRSSYIRSVHGSGYQFSLT